MEQLTIERLHDNLTRLKLTRAAAVLDNIVDQANDQKISCLGFLDHLLEEEVAAKEGRRIQTAMKTAGLPAAKTIEEYDFSFHPHLDRGAVMELFDLTFLSRKEDVLLLGPRGVGKTHFTIFLAIKAAITASRFTTPPWTSRKGRPDKRPISAEAWLWLMRSGISWSLLKKRTFSSILFLIVTNGIRPLLYRTRALPTGRSFLAIPLSLLPSSNLLHHSKVINIKDHSYWLRGHSIAINTS